MARKEKIALIGYGYLGKKLYKYLKESKKFELCSVFFPSLKNYDSKTIRSKFGNEFTSDIDTVWKNKCIPNVVIATPIDTHFKVVSCALSHSKNVLVEKPLAINAQEAINLARMAFQRKLILETEYTYTYSVALHYAKNMIEEGLIGRIQSICICFKQLGRFLPYDVYLLLGSHALSILDFFIPLTKFTFSVFPMMTTNDIVTSAIVQFQSRKKQYSGYIDLSLHCPRRDKKVILFGEKGTLMYCPEEKEALTLTLYQRRDSIPEQDLIEKKKCFNFDEKNNLKNALENFYELIHHKKKCNIDRAIRVNSVLNLLQRKIWNLQ